MPKPDRRKKKLALGYIRVSTKEQAEDGASLDAQRTALQNEADRRGWDLEIVGDEGLSGKSLKRPGLQSALARLDAGEADVLLAVRLDRISRSVADFAGLLSRARRRDWRVRLLNPDLDTEDPSGKFTAHVLAAAAEYERDLTSMRVREGMAQRKSEGARFGRRATLPDDVVRRIVDERADGRTYSAIAAGLQADGVATAQKGKRWYPATVKKVLSSAAAGRVTA